MKLAIVVHGRWDAFDLTRELSSRGHDVTLLTNYPRWAVGQFGVSEDRVASFWPHGVLSRALARIGGQSASRRFEQPLHVLFGRWADHCGRTANRSSTTAVSVATAVRAER